METRGNGKIKSLLVLLSVCLSHELSFLQYVFSMIVFCMFNRAQCHHHFAMIFCTHPDDKIVAMLLALQWEGSKSQEADYLSLSGVGLA